MMRAGGEELADNCAWDRAATGRHRPGAFSKAVARSL